jgi:hypothetical protein
MRTLHLNGLLVVAILLMSTGSLYAQRQQQNVAKLKPTHEISLASLVATISINLSG